MLIALHRRAHCSLAACSSLLRYAVGCLWLLLMHALTHPLHGGGRRRITKPGASFLLATEPWAREFQSGPWSVVALQRSLAWIFYVAKLGKPPAIN